MEIPEHVAARNQMVRALTPLYQIAIEPDEDASLDGGMAHRGEPTPGQLIGEEAVETERAAVRHELCGVERFRGDLLQHAVAEALLGVGLLRFDLIGLGIECP